MVIEDNRKVFKCAAFEDIKSGEAFQCDGELYIKTASVIHDEFGKVNAVHIESGKYGCSGMLTNVERIKAKVVVED